MTKRTFKQFLESARKSDEYWTELGILEFSSELARLLSEANITQAELARRINTSEPYVAKVLGGNANPSIATMAKFAKAFDAAVRIHLAPAYSHTRWIDDVSVEQQVVEAELDFAKGARSYEGRIFSDPDESGERALPGTAWVANG